MAKKYVSNSTESSRMFKSDLLEALSKVHFSIPIFVFVPVIAWFSYKAMKKHHMMHHYYEPDKGYGVSSNFWDKIFHSDFVEAGEKQG